MRVWCTCARGCVNSTDDCEAWEYVDHGDTTVHEYCTGLALNPLDENMVVYASCYSPAGSSALGASGRVHRTRDDGPSWGALGGGLPFPLPGQVVLAEFDQHNGLYIGTDAGDLYFSPDAGDQWVNVDHRLPVRPFHKHILDAVSMAEPSDATARFFGSVRQPVHA